MIIHTAIASTHRIRAHLGVIQAKMNQDISSEKNKSLLRLQVNPFYT